VRPRFYQRLDYFNLGEAFLEAITPPQPQGG
jgi:hypothetical protein